jgi:conjugative transfer signal peptidase TraF
LAVLGSTLLLLPSLSAPKPRIVWNLTPSVRQGPYIVLSPVVVEPGNLVVAMLPDPWQRYSAARCYIAAGVPILKRVAAVPGSTVCADKARIAIDGQFVTVRRREDGSGKPLPWWEGCRRIGAGQLFLLGDAGSASFDGRYFGPISRQLVLGKAFSLWPR